MQKFFQLLNIIGLQRYIYLLALAKLNVQKSGVTLPKELTRTDLVLVYLYTHQNLPIYHYKSINNVLRGKPHRRAKELRKVAQMITEALLKMPVHKGPCVRFVGLTPAEVTSHVVGSIVTFPAFTSSSADMTFKWALNVRYTISSSTGRDISAISRFPKEREVLFPPKSSFRVLQNSTKSGISHIVLEEV